MRKTKNALKALGAAVLGGAAAFHLLSAVTCDRVIGHQNIRVRSGKIPAELQGYRMAFITDVHYAPDRALRDAIFQVRARKPDLVLLGGDFARERDNLRRQLDRIAAIQPPDGIYGVGGNHDLREMLREEMEARSMILLENTGVFIKDRLYLCGVEDILKGRPDTLKAAEHAREEDFTLLLSHNPDVSMLYPMDKIDLMLSGHTHGGQVNVLGLYAPALSFASGYGQKFRAGRAEAQGKTVYVSRGVGSHRYLPRVLSQPQILHLTLAEQLTGNK